jgi:TolB-like protein
MNPSNRQPGTLRFGPFEVDLRSGELSRQGTRIKLRDKSFEVLVALATHPGEVVTRTELRERLWPEDVFVDFDNNLNTAVNRLRTALGDSALTPRYIETLPRRGYRFLVDVSPAECGPSVTGGPPSIAVLPFLDMDRERDQAYFCDGLSEELTNSLSRVRGLRVVARTSAFVFRDRTEDVREIGRKLNVSSVLEGSVQRSGDRLRVTVQLIDTATGCHLWSDRFDRTAGDVFEIEDEIARAVTSELRIKLLGQDRSRLSSRRTGDSAAHDLYLRGRYLAARRTPEAIEAAIRCFEDALSRDAGYSQASASLAECYCLSGFMGYMAPSESIPKAKAAAWRALDLDAASAEAHAVLGWAGWTFDWDWQHSESRLRSAEELAPSYGLARLWHSLLLTVLGRFDEALQEIDRARDLDPLSLTIQTAAGVVLYEARRYDEAAARLLEVLEMEPDYILANFHLGRLYLATGRPSEAVVLLEKAARFSNALGLLAAARARSGHQEEFERIRRELERASGFPYTGSFAFAWMYAATGDFDSTIRALERAFEAREGGVPFLNVDPYFDCIRPDRRFQALLRRLKFPAPKRGI